ncbi:hypothetical protein [Nonomuraea sp. NPDC050310]|uniref:hypothetical protein n=1 Tax=Nonomuraea sp. NPDC050310 TaxID=3154935 RepID=UPI0033C5BF72
MKRRLLALLLAIVTLIPLGATSALADPPVGGGNGSEYYVETQVNLSGNGHNPGGKTHIPPDFDPPKCWWEPKFTYAEMVEFLTGIQERFGVFGGVIEVLVDYIIEKILAEYKQYQSWPGKIFWLLTHDKTAEGEACYQATTPKWRVIQQVPVAENDKVIDPWDLAKIARANLVLPRPRIKINPPGGRSYVGLETWIGVRPMRPRSVTASVPGFPQLSATIRARPSAIRIETNGPGQVKSGTTCPLYTKGASLASGCWIKFTKSSLGGRYTITVTQLWEVTSTPNFNLPQGEVSASSTIQIDEIQSTVRK